MARDEKTHRDFKAGIDRETARRKREDSKVTLRKSKRDELLVKRREVQPGLECSTVHCDSQHWLHLPRIVAGCKNSAQPVEFVVQLRQLLSLPALPPMTQVVKSGLVPRLVEFLQMYTDPQLQFESACCLANLAGGDSMHCRAVVTSNAVPMLVQLLQAPDAALRQQCSRCLGNIARDCVAFRDIVLSHGSMTLLLQHIQLSLSHLGSCLNREQPMESLNNLRGSTWALCGFLSGKPLPTLHTIQEALPLMVQLLSPRSIAGCGGSVQDVEVMACTLNAICWISDGRHQLLIESGVLPRLVELLSDSSARVQAPAMTCLANIVASTDNSVVAMLLEAGLIAQLSVLLGHPLVKIRKEACWTLANISVGTASQTNAVLQSGVMPTVVQILANDAFEVKCQCAVLISNIVAGGNQEHIRCMVNMSVLPSLCELLSINDPGVILEVLGCINHILQAGQKKTCNPYAVLLEETGGLNQIEKLQSHENHDIYSRAAFLVDTFFGDDELNGDAAIAPHGPHADQFSFGVMASPTKPAFNFASLTSSDYHEGHQMH